MRNIIFLFIFFLCLLMPGKIVFAQTIKLNNNPLKTLQDSSVHAAVVNYMGDGTAHGLIIGIIKSGKRYTYCYGENRIGSNQLPSADAYFNIGSIAKTFVATFLAQAVIEKKVSLNDDIRKYLPGKYTNLEFKGQPIRIVDLANHTSSLPGAFRGFPAATMDSIKNLSFKQQAGFFNNYGREQLLQDLHKICPDTLPGTKFRYNSTAYSLLIFILENIYHETFDQLSSTYLKTHLHMEHTRPLLPIKDFSKVLQGYNNNNIPMPYVNLQGYYLGPSMNSTVNDMLIYISAQLSAKVVAIQLSHQQTWGDKTGFALGLSWMINSYDGQRYFHHDGNTKIGFNTLCTFYPQSNVGIVIMANDVHDLEKLSQLENAIKMRLK